MLKVSRKSFHNDSASPDYSWTLIPLTKLV